jgi:hypothetical protein
MITPHEIELVVSTGFAIGSGVVGYYLGRWHRDAQAAKAQRPITEANYRQTLAESRRTLDDANARLDQLDRFSADAAAALRGDNSR